MTKKEKERLAELERQGKVSRTPIKKRKRKTKEEITFVIEDIMLDEKTAPTLRLKAAEFLMMNDPKIQKEAQDDAAANLIKALLT